ncbi:head decoration protein [Caulobacter sp. 1776]|uniref:head decoration protein n=1 Tax=Caulobacter sp. 1776 TaxID=3156420 RepID=UPI0033948C67
MLKEGNYAGEFCLSEANGGRSRGVVTGAINQTLKAGLVIALVALGALSGAGVAQAGNTGNGAIGAVTVAAGTPAGKYQVRFIEPATNAGAYVVSDPEGVEIGHGTAGVAFTGGGLGFTIADGSTDFAAGDGFDVTVTAAAATDAGQAKPWDPTATNGLQHVHGIAWDTTVIGTATVELLDIERDAVVIASMLEWKTGLTDNQKAAGMAQLLDLGIVARA